MKLRVVSYNCGLKQRHQFIFQSLMAMACLWILYIAGCMGSMDPYHLCDAIRKGDPNAVEKILEETSCKPDEFARVSPYYAIAQAPANHRELTELLSAKGIDINGNPNYSPVTAAIQHNKPDLLALFLEKGAHADLSSQITAQQVATKLLMIGATMPKMAPLHHAADANSLKMVNALLQYKADVNTRNHLKETPLHRAAVRNNPDMMRALLKHKPDINAKDNEEFTPLHEACLFGHGGVVQVLLDAGADVNAETFWMKTPLDLTLESPNWEYARERGASYAFKPALDCTMKLIDAGGRFESVSASTLKPIIIRLANNPKITSAQQEQLLRFLLKQKTFVKALNKTDTRGQTPFMFACKSLDAKLLYLLLDLGARAEMVAKSTGATTLMLSSLNPNLTDMAFFNKLITCGADLQARSKNGEHLIHYASQAGNITVLQYCLEQNVDVNLTETSKQAWTALHYACLSGNIKTVQWLIDKGANVNPATSKLESPIHLAAQHNHIHIVEYLLAHQAQTPACPSNPQAYAQLSHIQGDKALVKANIEKAKQHYQQASLAYQDLGKTCKKLEKKAAGKAGFEKVGQFLGGVVILAGDLMIGGALQQSYGQAGSDAWIQNDISMDMLDMGVMAIGDSFTSNSADVSTASKRTSHLMAERYPTYLKCCHLQAEPERFGSNDTARSYYKTKRQWSDAMASYCQQILTTLQETSQAHKALEKVKALTAPSAGTL